ncbi:MAG: 3-dehydroquinate synthase [Bacteroidota bacterium]|jgi:3-dehydroquinate synthase
MKSMKIEGKYCQVEIGSILNGGFQSFLKAFENQQILIIVDENTHDCCLEYLITSFPELERAEIMLLPNGEENKVMEVCFQVWQAFTEYKVERKDLVINLGGGVVTDMGGFIASVYKRGLTFIHIPTTLLGMVDAAIGGKNGIDLNGFKNQLGTITQPARVFVDAGFLSTLPPEEIFNGYAEMLKHALIGDAKLWEEIRHIQSEEALIQEAVILQSIRVKTNIIEQDPFEGGLRKKLNFGHTVGHALESYFFQSTPISHGHAVALGMIAESFISMKRGILSKEAYKDIESTIIRSFPMIELNADDVSIVISLMYQDKKNIAGQIRSCLLEGIGTCSFDHHLTEEEIGESLFHLTLLANL